VTSDQPESSFDTVLPPSVPEVPGRLEQKTLTNEAFSVLPAPRKSRAVLVRMDSRGAGQVTSLTNPEQIIGRQPTNGVVVDDEGISRTHARIVVEDGRYFIEDLGSSNGTFVNGERIDRAPIFDGVVLQLGPHVYFRFSITDENQVRILRQLYESSVRDSLTGAYNRHYFAERLTAELAYATRHRGDAAVLLFDLDHFKKINDTYGHLAGDAVLKNVAAEATRLLRTEDVFARWGGEEFIVLLRGIPLSGAVRAGERLRQAIEALRTTLDGRVIAATASIGCASTACPERLDSTTLIAVADRRLYAAKRAGRNRVVAAD